MLLACSWEIGFRPFEKAQQEGRTISLWIYDGWVRLSLASGRYSLMVLH
jgi:hypothetical protein